MQTNTITMTVLLLRVVHKKKRMCVALNAMFNISLLFVSGFAAPRLWIHRAHGIILTMIWFMSSEWESPQLARFFFFLPFQQLLWEAKSRVAEGAAWARHPRVPRCRCGGSTAASGVQEARCTPDGHLQTAAATDEGIAPTSQGVEGLKGPVFKI